MIVRSWRGLSSTDTASAYLEHLQTETLPQLRAIDGHRGAYVLRRETGEAVEFVVLTLWDSLESVRAFAGDYEAAVVPPKARSLLMSFDERSLHYDVAIAPGSATSTGDVSSP